jgi:aspartyl-tRNA(Asn)/glutamyl-tRNA(Gln) amidotransferase subunit C
MDIKTVRNIAFLARIRIEEKDLAPMAKELSGILGWIEQLNEVKTDGVEPVTSVAALTLPRRQDRVTDGDGRNAVLKNAPEPKDGFFTVPKVVE